MTFEDFPSRKSPLINSDVLIKFLIEKDDRAKAKIGSYLADLNPNNNQFFIITDFILNDILVTATVKGIPHRKIIETLLPPYSSFYHLTICSGGIVGKALDSLKQYWRYNLTLTDWTSLWLLSMEHKEILISDKEEFDAVLSEPKLSNHFGNIRRV